ncbi:hypothetical protein O3P69_013632 [Scylla paramamosain]|uniref:PHD finger protein 20 n=1 Tax=Scylla paramamosain TaxID=85552 RepID=A0AAW0SSC7_SCYPA
MLKVGSKFYTFDELSSRLEEFQDLEQVQLWVRDSRTVVAAAKRARRKSLNPALKYAELTYSCVFGGRRPSDQTKIHNQTSAGGCPFKVRLSTSIDGQALVVKEICHEHNHEPGKKLHEEPRRLYKKTQNRTTVRKPVRYIVNKQRVSSGTCKTKSRLDHTESHVQLGQSPFHHLQLHQQQYQQQQQLKLQLQQHLQQQQQQQQQQQLHEKEAEVIQLDSPDHVDTPEHLSSPDLSTTFDQLGSLNNSVDQYTYLPPSPISPSLSSGCPVDCEEEERLEPILDLEEALEEALGDLDSVGSMEVDANLRLTSSGSTSSSLVSQSETTATDDPTGPPPAKRQRGRPRKQSFTGTPIKNEKSEAGKGGETKEDKSSDEEEDFLGFSPSTDKVLSGLQVTSKSDIMVSRADILQASAMARQLHVYKPGIDFVPGARLEVLESRDNNWYQCKIVEVDWGELDILVHYERWSNRFDEWLKMDSTRIRSLSRTSQRREKRNSAYSVGDRVLARWSADGKRYQARVTKELGDDQFEVLFFDGVAKVLRSTALAKVDSKVGEIEEQRGTPSKQPVTDDEDSLLSPGATSASSTDSRSSSPEPGQSSAVSSRVEELMEVETVTPVRKNIFDVEIIEQKRKSKRKAAVEELFQSLKKRRKYEHQSQGKVPTSSPRHQQQQLMQQEQQKPQQQQKQQQQQQQIRSTQSRKTSFSKKKGREAATESQEEIAPHQAEATTSEAPDSPVLSPRIVSIDMSDGWKKCCSQRTHGTTAGKWDTFYLAPDGKKIRSKNDLYRYCEEFKVTCDIEKFDFSVKNMREVIDGQTDARSNVKANEEQKESEKDPSTSEVKEPEVKFPVQELCGITKTATGKKPDMKKSEIRQTDVSKHSESPRMKLEIPIIPKTEHIGTLPPSLLGASAAPWSPTMPSSLPRSLPASASTPSGELMGKDPVGVGGYTSTEPTPEPMRPSAAPIRQRHVLKKEPVLAPNEFVVCTEHNDHQCPKDGCGKSFRKENLLQMHIKHYHPELLKKTSNWAPNVADLAYARTVGDHLDTSSSPTHASPPVDKMGKSETGSKKAPRGLSSVSSPDARGKVVDKKTSGSIKTIIGSKDSKKRDKSKLDSEQGPPISEDEIESKEEVEDLAEDIEVESPISTLGLQSEDPDYVPSEGEVLLMRKDRKEKRKTRGESKGKKKKIAEVPLPEPSSASPSKKTPGPEAEAPSIEAEEDTGDAWAEGTEGVPTSETSAEIINCGCGSTEEEGLMLQCDVCLCWQHGDCYNIVGEDQVPDKYICSLCDHPRLERSSHKFRHHQDWLKEGRLPRFSFSSSRGDLRLEACVRRGHELTANVQQLSQILHSLRLKLHIAREADHPKFVMWHKKWNEREESPPHGKEKSYTSPAAVAPLQDFMDIVDQEDPSLDTKVTDTKVPDLSHQTANLSSDITLGKTETEESGERLATSPTILSGTWNQGTTEIQKFDIQMDDGKEVMRSQKDLADSNKGTVNDKNEPENSMTVDAEKVVTGSSEVF